MPHKNSAHNHIFPSQLVMPVGFRTSIEHWEGNRHWTDRVVLTPDFRMPLGVEARLLLDAFTAIVASRSAITASFEYFDENGSPTLRGEHPIVHGKTELTDLQDSFMTCLYDRGLIRTKSNPALRVERPSTADLLAHAHILSQVVLIEHDAKGTSKARQVFELAD